MKGNDTISGGDGADTFVFSSSVVAGEQDRVTDFQDGIDVLRLLAAHESAITFADSAGGTTLTVELGAVDYTIFLSGVTGAQVADQMDFV